MVKFEDCILYSKLNGVYVKFEFKNDYFGSGSVPHIELRSLIEDKPNVFTETGYRSYFFDVSEEEFSTLKEMIEYIAKNNFEWDWKERKRGKKKPEILFEWVNGTETELLEIKDKNILTTWL